MCATIVVVTGAVTIASAQDNRDANANELLDVGLSVTGAYDSDTNTVVPFPGSGQLQPAGPSAWGVGSLDYIRRSARAVLQTSASSALRYLPDLQEFHSVMHGGSVSLSAPLPKRFGLEANTALAYSPSYLYGLFPTLPSTSAVEPPAEYADPYDVDVSSSYSSNSSISLGRRVGRRSSVSVVADFTHTNFSNATPTDIPTDIPIEFLTRPDLTVFSLGAEFSRNFTRDTALSAGYRYNTGEFGYRLGQTTGEHAVDVGFNTTRRVSATRRIDLLRERWRVGNRGSRRGRRIRTSAVSAQCRSKCVISALEDGSAARNLYAWVAVYSRPVASCLRGWLQWRVQWPRLWPRATFSAVLPRVGPAQVSDDLLDRPVTTCSIHIPLS